MKKQVEAARAAHRLWKSDSRLGTFAAVVLLLAFVGWPLFRFWRASRSGGAR